MCDICVDNFLTMCHPNHAERHSKSSDFENPNKIPLIAPKSGNHRLVNIPYSNESQDQFDKNYKVLHNNLNSNRNKTRNKQCCADRETNGSTSLKCDFGNSSKLYPTSKDYNTKCNEERTYARSIMRGKVIPCLSTVFRRSNIDVKETTNRVEGETGAVNSCDTAYRLKNKRHHAFKANRRDRGYSVQPVYTLEEEVKSSPFQLNNNIDDSCNTKLNNNCDPSYDVSLSSEPDEEKNKNYQYINFLKRVKEKLEKEMLKERHTVVKDQQQQFPSKLNLKLPYQVYTSTSCLAKCSSIGIESITKVQSTSSAFWDFFAQKMKGKIQSKNPCDCIKPSVPCRLKTCQNLTSSGTNSEPQVENNNHTDQSSSIGSNVSNKKEPKKSKIVCKCYSKKKPKTESKQSPIPGDNKSSPCQESHDNITRAISEKYNGQILCIHNPPCILINGCLNLPPPKSNIQGNLWPVTQETKSSFMQMYRKMKRSKQKTFDNGSQYHPPYVDLEQCLPEFKTEKIIQSVCNHDPPCEIVRGCYRPRYDPKVQNSCVHVPMCQKLPECVLKTKKCPHLLCTHNPKCAEFPLCSRKYIVLTAREEIGTQVRSKMKMVCRHQPECFVIPKCLAQAIKGDHLPHDAIPGCTHNPPCENIPVCCRKFVKQMSTPSQNPNGCRIV